MPFVRAFLPSEITDQQLAGISDAIHDSMVRTFNVPPEDRFQVLTRHPRQELVFAPRYLDIAHSPKLAIVQITCNDGRTVQMKKDLFAALAASIEAAGGIPAADVIVSLVEVRKENWSFGNGAAQYAM